MRRLLVIVGIVLLGGAAVAIRHGRATAYAPPNHHCAAVASHGLAHTYPILIQTRDVSCVEALTVVRAMVSNVGVTFVGNPNGPASQFRWKLYGLPGWTCYGDGAGFPGHGAGGTCAKGGATVQWYHA